MWKISRGIKELTDRFDRLIALQSEYACLDKSKKAYRKSFVDDKFKQNKCCIVRYFELNTPLKFCFALRNHFKKNRQEKAGNSWEDFHLKPSHSWLGAAGWSGALVLGWYTWQPLLRWNRHHDAESKYLIEEKKYVSLFKLIKSIAFAQPTVVRSILPSLPEPEYVQYGPISAEQDLEEAAEALVRVRLNIAAEVEHQHGMEWVEVQEYKKAVKHFKAASKLNYAPAAYNLALCHERGLGTSQDFKKAAHWYKVASDLGHAGAKYNLGVFHAHGWGGVKADPEIAHELLMSAAALGHPEAISALALNSQNCPTIAIKCCSTDSNPSKSKLKEISDTIKSYAFSPKLSKSRSIRNKKFSFSSASELDYDSSTSSDDKFNASNINVSTSPVWTDSGCSSSEQTDEVFTNEYYTGMCYENGWGVSENLPLATEFYSKAALNGNSEALYNLAVSYESDSNYGSKDPHLIIQLYQMAAENGSVLASERLKTLETYESLGILEEAVKENSKKSSLTKKTLF